MATIHSVDPKLDRRALLALAPAVGLALTGCTKAHPPEPALTAPTFTALTTIAGKAGADPLTYWFDTVFLNEQHLVIMQGSALRAIDTTTGHEAWSHSEADFKKLFPRPVTSTEYYASNRTNPTLMTSGSTDEDERFHLSIDGETLKVNWLFPATPLAPEIRTNWVGGNESVFIFTSRRRDDISTIGVDAQTGAQLWKVDNFEPGGVTATRVVGTLNDKTGAAITLDSGVVTEFDIRPARPYPYGSVGDQLIGMKNERTLFIFDVVTGKKLSGETTAISAVFGTGSNGQALVANLRGTIAAGESGTRKWDTPMIPLAVHQGYIIGVARSDRKTMLITDRNGTPIGAPVTPSIPSPEEMGDFYWAGSAFTFRTDTAIELYSWKV